MTASKLDALHLSIKLGSDQDKIFSQLTKLTLEEALYINKQQKTWIHELLVTRNIPYNKVKQWIQYLIKNYFAKNEDTRRVLSSADDSGSTVLHYAAQNENIDIELFKYLIDSCLPGTINEVNMFKWNPLHYASSHGKHEIVRFLLQQGCNKNAITMFNTNAREIAWVNLHHETVRVLDEWESSQA